MLNFFQTVSKIHAEIEAMKNQESSIWIYDLNSSNKTKLGDVINTIHFYYLHSVYIIIPLLLYHFAFYVIFEQSLLLFNPVYMCKDNQLNYA